MKRLFVFIALLAITVSCAEREQDVQVIGSRSLTVHVQGVKSYLGEVDTNPAVFWGKDEFLGLYYNDGNDNFAKSDDSSKDVNNGKLSGAFSFTSLSPEESDVYTLGAIYPASAAVAASNKMADSYKVVLPSIQNATATSYDPAAFIMVAKTEEFNEFPSEWTASFYRAVALNQLVLAGVKESVKAVEISAEGKDLCGGRFFDLTVGTANEVYSGSPKITVKFAQAIPAGYVDVYFTSWDAELKSGDKLTVKVIGASNTYTKTITAGASGIKFKENNYCTLTVDFSEVEADPDPTAFDFARAFAGELDVWENTTGSVTPYPGAGYMETGHIIPQDYSFFVGTNEYNKAEALYVAANLYNDVIGKSLSFAEAELLPKVASHWGDQPYNEGPGNGGPFKVNEVSLAFVTNVCTRTLNYHNNNSNTYANMCGPGSHISGYTDKGACCLERVNLLVARVFKYIVDNDIRSDVKNALADKTFKSDLYEPQLIAVSPTSFSGCSYSGDSKTVTVDADAAWTATLSEGCDWITLSPASGSEGKGQSVTITVAANTGDARSATVTFKTSARSKVDVSIAQDGVPSTATIQDFAEAYVGLLDVWNSNRGNLPGGSANHTRSTALTDINYIPFDATITVLGKAYNVSQCLEIAMRSYLLLMGYDGNNTTKVGAGFPAVTPAKMSDVMPGSHNYKINLWYMDDSVNGGPMRYKGEPNVLYSDMMVNYSERNVNFPNNNSGQWGNNAGYPRAPFNDYSGSMIPGRAQLTYIRVFKMILDNKVTENINTFLDGKPIDSTCYNNAEYD